MTDSDDDIERELDILRERYRAQSRDEPSAETDALLHAAARRRRRSFWPAATALAACVALAVMLLPTLLVEVERDVQPVASEVRLMSERETAAMEVRRAQRESAARQEAPAAATSNYAEAKSEMPEALAAPAEPAAPLARERTIHPPYGVQTDSALSLSKSRERRLDALRTELAGANERAWRTRLLALRAEGQETLAEQLLADFRERFDRPEDFSLDELAAEPASENE